MTDRKFLTTVLLLLALYVMCYGFARWRKCIVMAEYFDIELFVRTGRREMKRELRPGYDVRSDWRGRFKNRANPHIHNVMYPLVWIENEYRGSG